MPVEDVSLSFHLKSFHFSDATHRPLSPRLSNILSGPLKQLGVPDKHCASSAFDCRRGDERTLPSLSELGFLDLHKKIPRDGVNNRNMPTYAAHLPVNFRNCPPLTWNEPLNAKKCCNIVEILNHAPDRTSSPSSDTVSDMAIDVASPHTAAAKIIDSPASSCISLEATNRRLGRTDTPDTLWLVHVVKTTRKDKNGASLYQCQFEGCGHEQTKQAVKRHVNDVHFNIRPWICQYCSRPFKQKSSLGIHIHSRHTFEKPYDCDHCDECFSDPARRNKHVKRFHPDKPSKPRPKVAYPRRQ